MELVDKYSDTLKDFGVFTVETLKPKSKKDSFSRSFCRNTKRAPRRSIDLIPSNVSIIP